MTMTPTDQPPSDPDLPSGASRPPDRTVAFGPRATEVYDVWDPTAPTAEAGLTVVLVHGGFWRAAYDRHHLEPLATALAANGFTVASLEYARIGMPGGGWPGTGADVAAAMAALAADPDLPQRFVAVGHSAGGHLVLWLGSRPDVRGLLGVVSLAGACDLRLVDELGLSDGVARELVGYTPDKDPDAWHDADPAVQSLHVPATLLHGTDDDIVPLTVSTTYAGSRTFADAAVRLLVLPEADHFAVIDPGHPAYREVVREIRALAHP